MGNMFTMLFTMLTTLFQAGSRFANALNNLAEVTEVASAGLVDEQQQARAKASIAAKKELAALK